MAFISDEVQTDDHIEPPTTDTPIVTKIEEYQDTSTNLIKETDKLVTLIETPRTSLATVLGRCEYCQKGVRVTKCYFDQTSVCGYFRQMHYVYPTSCVQHKKLETGVPQGPSIPEEKVEEKIQDKPKSVPEEVKKTTDDKHPVREENKIDPSSQIPVEKSSVVTDSPIDPTPALPKDPSNSHSQTQQDVKPSSSQTVSPSIANEKQELPKATADSKLADSPKQDTKDDDSPKESNTDFDNCVQKGGTIINGVRGSSCTMGPESLDARPVVREETIQVQTDPVPTETKTEAQHDAVNQQQQQQQQEVKKQQIPPNVHAQQQQGILQQQQQIQQQQAQQNQQQQVNKF